MEKRRRRREVVLLRKRLGLSEHSFWNKASVSRRRDRQQYERRHAKTRNVSEKLSLVNARGLWICKIRYAIATPPPAVAALPRGVSSLTWTAGESRAVLFLGKQIARKKRKQVSEIEQY
jgi:hypothetical protein